MRYLIFIVIAIALAGCGKQKAPAPPVAHTLLVKKLFRNLANNQHELAYKRVQKVQALAPADEFLIQMEEREYCNYMIKKAQLELNKGNTQKSQEVIEDARIQYPLNRHLIKISNELKNLASLQKNVELLNKAASSSEMNKTISRIEKIIKRYPAAKELRPLLRKQILKAFNMNLYEKQRARFDLLCDLHTIRNEKYVDQGLADTLKAMLIISNEATINPKERINPNLLED